jgi:hypothetical protein
MGGGNASREAWTAGTEAVQLESRHHAFRWGLRPVGHGGSIRRAVTRGTVDPTGICEHGRGTGWIVQEPARSHEPPRAKPDGATGSPAPGRRARSPFDEARERTRTSERHVGPASESISDRVSGMGSRSVLVVPTTSGNLALGDPTEGRGAPQWQNCRWETRRAL